MRVLLVVLEKDVKSRLMLFDEIGLEDESLNLVIDNDELKILDKLDHSPRFRVHVAARLEILSYAVAQAFRLADIDDLARGIFVEINARRGRQLLQLFGKRHV